MAETLLSFQTSVVGDDGMKYEARACGTEMRNGSWEGWIEFDHCDGGEAVRTSRETTQPNRTDLAYWAGGLTAVYLEGALNRALERPEGLPPAEVLPRPPAFNGPAARMANGAREPMSVLNPFSVYQKGEALLRQQLAALSPWHLVNIAVEYRLSDHTLATLNQMSARELIDEIIEGVREPVSSR